MLNQVLEKGKVSDIYTVWFRIGISRFLFAYVDLKDKKKKNTIESLSFQMSIVENCFVQVAICDQSHFPFSDEINLATFVLASVTGNYRCIQKLM